MRAADYLAPTGFLPKMLPGYVCRPAQMEMAEAVNRALDDDGVLLVEAGTGTGKTLAYLLPAVLDGRRVVISTGTIALQDQIMEHDLPLISRLVGSPVSAVSLKGLSNYLCLRRFEEFRRSAASVSGAGAKHLPLIEAWRGTTKTGDRSELKGLPEDSAAWAGVMSSADTRIGAPCSYFDACFVTKARQAAADAQVVVVNHHLYFADLATRGPHGGGFLPDHDIVIFDEAHQIEDTMTNFFGVSVSMTRIERLLRDAAAAFSGDAARSESDLIMREVAAAAGVFFESLPAGGAGPGRVALSREAFSGTAGAGFFRLDSALDALASHGKGRLGTPEGEGAMQVARRAQKIRDELAVVSEGASGKRVAWIEDRGKRSLVGASPVDVADVFRDEVVHRHASVVLTSATMATGSSFSFIKQRLGLEETTTELCLPSPFDFPRQAALYVPASMPDPRESSFAAKAADEIVALVGASGGGAFVLCTSVRSKDLLASLCTPRVGVPVMIQGEAPKAELLARFRDEGNAVLFATSSFWEGIDVPGDALRLVIIDKLPFDVPTDPVIVARCQRLEEAGEQPFIRYLVPSAALSLKQGFGRLIRTERDRGVVAVLDRRLVTKGYGKVFMRALPPARRCETLDDVRAFYREARAEVPF